jgi:ribosomal protein S18 acetylase RimI-like enzyme
VRRELPGGFELDDDRARIDAAAVHDFLSNHAYWAKGRPLATVERLIGDAQRVVGLYHEGRQIGFTRTVSDGASLAYLADVYVLPEYRGRGLGVELVRETVEAGAVREVRLQEARGAPAGTGPAPTGAASRSARYLSASG